MFFLSRTNKFFSAVTTIKPTHRYVLTLFAIGGLFYGWIALLHVPTAQAINQHQQNISHLKQQQRLFGSSQTACVQLERSVQDLQHSLQSHINVDASVEDATQQMMFFVLEQAREQNLLLNAFTLGEKKEMEWQTKTMADVDLTGSPEQIMTFLDTLTTTDYLIDINHMQLSRVSQDECNVRCVLDLTCPAKPIHSM